MGEGRSKSLKAPDSPSGVGAHAKKSFFKQGNRQGGIVGLSLVRTGITESYGPPYFFEKMLILFEKIKKSKTEGSDEDGQRWN